MYAVGLPDGQLTVQVLRAAGCGLLMAADIDASRLGFAKQFGADEVIRSDQADAVARVQQLTGGRGVGKGER